MSDRLFKWLIAIDFFILFIGSVFAGVLNKPDIFLRTFLPVVIFGLLVVIIKLIK